MFSDAHFENPPKTLKHINTNTPKPGQNEQEVIVAMVIDNLQTYRKENISSRSCTLLSTLFSSRLGRLWRNTLPPDDIACVERNHITSRYLFHRQSAKWFVFIIILLLFMRAGAFSFIVKTAGFRILFSSIVTIFYRTRGDEQAETFSMFSDPQSLIVKLFRVFLKFSPSIGWYIIRFFVFFWWFSCLLCSLFFC